MTDLIDTDPNQAPAGQPSPRHELASVQQVIWLDQMINPDLPHYNVGVIWEITGAVDASLLERAVQRVAHAHDALRLGICSAGGAAVQTARDRVDVQLDVLDLAGEPDAERLAQEQLRKLAGTPFALDGSLLFRSHLVRVHATRHYWLHMAHHLISDGAGIVLASDMMLDDYARLLRGEASEPEPGPSYLELLTKDRAYLESPRYSRDREFWSERFASPPPALYAERAGAMQEGVGRSDCLLWHLAQPTFVRLQEYAAAYGCSPQHFLLALMAAYFARAHQLDEVVLGVPVHNRGTGREKRTVGMFSSMLPIGARVEREQPFHTLIQAVAAELRRCYRHQRFPLCEINRTLRLTQVGRKQLFDVTVTQIRYPPVRTIADSRFSATQMDNGFEQTPLALCIREYPDADDSAIEFHFNTALLERSEVESLQRRLERMLQAVLTSDAAMSVGSLPWTSDDERRQLLRDWNDTAVEFPRGLCVHQLFEACAARHADAIAVVAGERQLGYAELNARANRLAHHLQALGVGPDDRVGICVERSLEMVVGLLAILKAGGCYVPLDPDYPAERLGSMLQDCAAKVVLVDGVGASALRSADSARFAQSVVIDLIADSAAWASAPDANLPCAEGADHQLAYIIYTSGSTGEPKGVMNEHRGVVNRLFWMQQAYALGERDVVLQKTPFSFDVSVWEFFWPLMVGAPLVMARPDGHKDPRYLSELIRTAGVTTLHFVPSMLQPFLAQEGVGTCHSLKRVMCSGEALPAALVRSFHSRLPKVELHNLYGPTEAAVDVTAWSCCAEDTRGVIPIGRPIANTRIYILDQAMQPVPVGVAGEIYIGGVQVARGYLHRPELTAARFVADPFVTDGRLYKTGDLARYLPDGVIEYLGRNDFQVKLRGMRIELGEIESKLLACPGVEEAVVVARGSGQDQRLVAYFTGEHAPDADTLQARARASLPPGMVPAAYVKLAAMPLSANGKLDRKALPAPDMRALTPRSYEAPRGQIEQTLAALWAELLKLERVGRNDNFFELGGHSLLAVGLMERMRQLGLHAEVRKLYTAPTLAALAELVSNESDEEHVPPNLIAADARRITPEMLNLVELSQEAIDAIVRDVEGGAENVQDIYPLAPLQEGILFHHLMQAGRDPYLMVGLFAFDSMARVEQFVDALERVVNRHDILRTGIAWQGLEQPVQVVRRTAQLPFEWLGFDAEHGDIEEQLCAYEVYVDVSQAPLLRCLGAYDAAGARWLVRLVFHHLAIDHTTLEEVLKEARSIERGELALLPAPAPFRDFVARARSPERMSAHEAFFGELLRGFDAPSAPFDLVDVQRDGTGIAEARRTLSPELARGVRALARTLGVSPASVMHLAWALVVARTSGRRDVVFGTVLLGRMGAGRNADRVLGLFINTVPVRVRVDRDSVEQGLRSMHSLLIDLLQHQHAPLVLAQRAADLPARTPLFSALLNYRFSNQQADQRPLADALGEGIELLHAEERTNFPISLSVDDLGEDFAITAHVVQTLAPERVCDLMQTALAALLHAVEQTPELPLSRVDALPPRELEALRERAHGPQLAGSPELTIHERFEAQAERSPDALALICGEQALTYRELNARANQLARTLRERGVRAECLVGLALERSAALIVGLLAVLKAGGAYVPLDPSYPAARLRAMLDDAAPVCVLSEAALRGSLPAGATVVLLDEEQAAIARQDTSNLEHAQTRSAQLAYVIYTSGSTGTPKGVMVEHRQVLHLWSALEHAIYRHHPDCVRVGINASLSFDAAVKQWVQLLSGRTLVMIPSEVRADGEALRRFVSDSQIDVLDCTPSQLALPCGQSALRAPAVTLVGGEAISPAALWEALASASEQTYYNVYGPTECTVDATVARVQVGVAPHIGTPIANVRVHVLDDQLRPTPIDVAGELYIGGAGVARGYLNQAPLIAQRFLEDPFCAGERLYKTGDLACWRADGQLAYLGRNDSQVKLRGFRVELGEIEAKLAQAAWVEAVVATVREDAPGEPRLIAYYTGERAGPELLRRHAEESLPAHMVPAGFVHLDALPLTPNAKLDRTALPAPEEDAYARGRYVAPRGHTEQALAAIWTELLQVESVGRHDNFFELGGHSLLAVRLLSRLRMELAVELPLRTLFERPELSQLAACVGAASAAELPPIAHVDRAGPLALSLAQQRLWFLTQLEGASEAYHISGALHVGGALDLDALRAALARVAARHEPLRTTFELVDGQPMQRVHERFELPMTVRDLRGEDASQARVQVLCSAEAQRSFDLGSELPWRVQLLQLSQDAFVLHVVMHHIASDGWSIGIFLHELSVLYTSHREGRTDRLPELTLQLADYAAWQRSSLCDGQLAEQSEFWRQNLAGVPSLLELPTDRVRPRQQDHRGASVPVRLDAARMRGLKALSQRHGVTLYMTMLASFAALLQRLSNQADVVIGTPVAGRNRAELEPLIGFFVNTLALRIDLRGAPTVAELLALTKQQVLAAQQHQDLPFDQVVELVAPPRSPAHTPVFQVMLDWNNTPVSDLRMADLKLSVLESELTTAQCDLSLSLRDGEIVQGVLNYATSLFDRATVEGFVSCWLRMLDAMVVDDEPRLEAVSLLSAEELLALRESVPLATSVSSVQALFESEVRKAPERVAVDDGDERLTYAELNRRSNQLAHYLRSLGVRPEQRVGLCAERGAAMVVGLLGIWKSGAAYVPLDPSYPAERLAFMLADSAPVVVLTSGTGAGTLQAHWAGEVLDLRGDAWRWSGQPEDDPAGAEASQLAYVIYTSGSTGTPKGVMVEHGSLVNYALEAQRWFALGCDDVVLQQNSLNFDLSLEELVPALVSGSGLVMRGVPFGMTEAGSERTVQASVVHLTAAHFHRLVSEWSTDEALARRQLGGVRLLNVTGDALSPQKLSLWESLGLLETRVINTYGPTEATVSCSAAYVRSETSGRRVSIGRAFANTRLYVLDGLGQPVPSGVTGELYVGGVQVARGYLNRPELSSERFLSDPFVAGERMYKTGDLVRARRDGELEFLGRNDDQVKVRGFRVELGEVESQLATTPGVRELVAHARTDERGDKRVVVYYTGDASEESLRQRASTALASYMQPSAYVALESLPRTANGKLDRGSLPEPGDSQLGARAYAEPVGEIEQALSRIWSELLKLPRVGRHDDFFQLGGHSLLAISLIERMRRENLHADVRALFLTPTVAELALQLRTESDAVVVPPNLIENDTEEFRL